MGAVLLLLGQLEALRNIRIEVLLMVILFPSCLMHTEVDMGLCFKRKTAYLTVLDLLIRIWKVRA